MSTTGKIQNHLLLKMHSIIWYATDIGWHMFIHGLCLQCCVCRHILLRTSTRAIIIWWKSVCYVRVGHVCERNLYCRCSGGNVIYGFFYHCLIIVMFKRVLPFWSCYCLLWRAFIIFFFFFLLVVLWMKVVSLFITPLRRIQDL